MRSILCIFAIISLSQPAVAQTAKAALSPKDQNSLAEYIFASQLHAKVNLDWVKKSGMSTAHKNDILRYMKKHKLEAMPLPKMKWIAGTSKLEVGDKKQLLDFSRVQENMLIVDGRAFQIKKYASVEDVLDTLNKAHKPSAQLMDLIIPTAFAKRDEGGIGAVIAYWTGLDQLIACSINERLARSNCVFRSNASMLKMYLGNDRLIEFKCNNGKFQRITTGKWLKFEMALYYNSKNQLSKVITKQDGTKTCQYNMKDEKIESIKEFALTTGYCEGVAVETYSHGVLRPGDTPEFLATSSISLPRLRACCEEKKCAEEMMSIVDNPDAQETESENQKIDTAN